MRLDAHKIRIGQRHVGARPRAVIAHEIRDTGRMTREEQHPVGEIHRLLKVVRHQHRRGLGFHEQLLQLLTQLSHIVFGEGHILAGTALILSGNFDKLVAIASFLFVAVYLSGFCALFVLRAREPNLPRPFKLWGYPWTNGLVLLASAAFLIASIAGDLKDALFTLVLIAMSYPVYWLMTWKKRSPLETAGVVADP